MLIIMSLSKTENLFAKLKLNNYTAFRRRRLNKMGNPTWENVFISTKGNGDAAFSSQKEIVLEVITKRRTIEMEYIDETDSLKKIFAIRFSQIEETNISITNAIIIRLEDGSQIKLTFGTKSARDDFNEAITISSSDSGQWEDSS